MSGFASRQILGWGGVVLALAAVSLAEQLLGSGKWVHAPFHSAIEAFGTVAAVTLGAITLMMRSYRGSSARVVWVACGLIVMGILDGFHAAVHPGNSFVWLHSTATFAGGLFFALAWLPDPLLSPSAARILPASTAVAAGLLGAISIVLPEIFPAMLSEGRFTPVARAINVVGGIFFLAAAARLFSGSRSNNDRGMDMFAILALLFGAAGLLFDFSQAWETGWWLWHLMRLAAYAMALFLVLAAYRIFLRQTGDSIVSISTAASEIAATMEQHERTVSQQTAAATEVTSTAEELGASAVQSANQAESAALAAKEALALTREGAQLAIRASAAMSGMKQKIDSVAEQILRLSEQAGQIGGIAKVVGELAGETNMLALNAAVEAARAGEQGKGFAVVAAEVRKLADQSKKSAERANALVADIQKATNSAVMVTEEGSRSAEEVTAIAQSASQAFASIAGAANRVSENAQQVTLNSKQQSTALGQVTEAMRSLAESSRQIAAGTEQTKVGVQKLNQVALGLKAMV